MGLTYPMTVKRKAGGNPARSRRCKGKAFFKNATGKLGRLEKAMIPSQKACLFFTPKALRKIGG